MVPDVLKQLTDARERLWLVAGGLAFLVLLELGIGLAVPRWGYDLLPFLCVVLGLVLAVVDLRLTVILLLASSLVFWILRLPLALYSVQGRQIEIPHVLAGVLVGVWALNLLMKGERPAKSALYAPMFAMVGISLLSLLASYALWDPTVPTEHRKLLIQITEIGLLALSVGLAIIVAQCARRMHDIRLLFTAILAISIVALVWEVWAFYLPSLTEAGSWLETEIRSPLIIPPIGLALVYAQLLYGSSVRARLGWFTLFALLLWANWATASPVYHAAALVALLSISLVRAPKLFVIIALVVVIFIAAGGYSNIMQFKLGSGMGRIELARWGMRVWLSHPVFGVGPGNYAPYTEKYRELAPLVFTVTGRYRPHNDLLYWLATTGIAGMTTLLWFLITFFREGWALYRRVQDRFSKAMILGVLGGWLAGLVASLGGQHCILVTELLASFFSTMYSWSLVGLVIARQRQEDHVN